MRYDAYCNRMIVEIEDLDRLSEMYDLFEITCDKEVFNTFPKIIDRVFESKRIVGTVYEPAYEEQKIYVVSNKGTVNKEELEKYAEEDEPVHFGPFEFSELREINEKGLIQLLFNSLNVVKTSGFRFNNLAEKCFLTKDGSKKAGKKYSCLEAQVNKDEECYSLSIETRNFCRMSDVVLKIASKTTKKRYNCGPYFEAGPGFFKRVFDTDKKTQFIMAPPKNRKNTPYLTVQGYEASRLFFYWDVLERFNEKYEEICRIRYDVMEDIDELRSLSSFGKLRNLIYSELKGRRVRIINLIPSDEGAEEYCSKLLTCVKGLGCNASTENCPEHGEINLVLIHEEEWYLKKKLFDEHDRFKEYVLQHFTIKKSKPFIEYEATEESPARILLNEVLMEVFIKEVMIKYDMFNEWISLDNWSKRNFDKPMTFCRFFIYYVENGNKKEKKIELRSLTVCPGGRLHYGNDVLNQNTVKRSIDLARKRKLDDQSGIIVYGEEINLITPTHMFPVIGREVFEVITGPEPLKNLKSLCTKEDVLYPMFNIRLRKWHDKYYYSCGQYPGQFNKTASTVPNYRCIESLNEDGRLLYDEIKGLMRVGFVKYKRPAAMPYPFKYLDERIALERKNLTPKD